MSARTHRSVAAVAFGLSVALVIPAPAPATHGGNHPAFRPETVYFHCAGPTKVENVNEPINGATRWSTAPPAGSVLQGAGCLNLDTGVFRGAAQETPWDAVFKGTFTGNLRDLTVRLHNLALSRIRPGTTFGVRVRLSIDGTPIIPEPSDGWLVTITPVPGPMGVSEYLEFSIMNLGFAREVHDAQGKLVDVDTGGLATEDGEGADQRELTIVIDGSRANGDFTENSAWVWDAAEFPSGIVFNPPKLANAKLWVPLPDGG